MTATWQKETDDAHEVSYTMREGDSFLAVDELFDQRWKYVAVRIGRFTNAPLDECLETWPVEAIRRLRRELDKLEAKLIERKTDEASIH